MKTQVCIVKGNDPYLATKDLLERLKFKLKNKTVLIKPNLTISTSPHSSITTDVDAVRAILEKLKNCKIIIGEGSYKNTMQAFEQAGYFELKKDFQIEFIDLNKDVQVAKTIPRPIRFSVLPIAKSVLDCDYLINASKLKIHGSATVTLCMKNLFGTVPTRKNRIIIHPYINEAICDYFQVLHPDLNIVDGIIGNQHDEILDNPIKSGIVIGGYDAISTDIIGAKAMSVDPNTVKYLRIAQQIFGKREIDIIGEQVELIKKKYISTSGFSTNLRYFTEQVSGSISRISPKFKSKIKFK